MSVAQEVESNLGDLESESELIGFNGTLQLSTKGSVIVYVFAIEGDVVVRKFKANKKKEHTEEMSLIEALNKLANDLYSKSILSIVTEPDMACRVDTTNNEGVVTEDLFTISNSTEFFNTLGEYVGGITISDETVLTDYVENVAPVKAKVERVVAHIEVPDDTDVNAVIEKIATLQAPSDETTANIAEGIIDGKKMEVASATVDRRELYGQFNRSTVLKRISGEVSFVTREEVEGSTYEATNFLIFDSKLPSVTLLVSSEDEDFTAYLEESGRDEIKLTIMDALTLVLDNADTLDVKYPIRFNVGGKIISFEDKIDGKKNPNAVDNKELLGFIRASMFNSIIETRSFDNVQSINDLIEHKVAGVKLGVESLSNAHSCIRVYGNFSLKGVYYMCSNTPYIEGSETGEYEIVATRNGRVKSISPEQLFSKDLSDISISPDPFVFSQCGIPTALAVVAVDSTKAFFPTSGEELLRIIEDEMEKSKATLSREVDELIDVLSEARLTINDCISKLHGKLDLTLE